MADRTIMSLPSEAPDRPRSEDRDEILREQWSEGFAAKLLRTVRRAIGEEIRAHKDAGRTIPGSSPDEVRTEAPRDSRN